MPRRIIICVGHPTASEVASLVGLNLATMLNCEASFVHVQPPGNGTVPPRAEWTSVVMATQRSIPHTAEIKNSPSAVDAIVRHSQSRNDIICIGTHDVHRHNTRHQNQHYIGSIAEGVISTATCAVVTVRPECADSFLARPPGAERELRAMRMIVACDRTPLSVEALRLALPLAISLKAEVTLARVHDPDPRHHFSGSGSSDETLDARMTGMCLQNHVNAIPKVLKCIGSALDAARVASVILNEAQGPQQHCLIVCGSSGLISQSIEKQLIGSVSEAIILDSTVPVFTINPRLTEVAESHSHESRGGRCDCL